MFCTKCGYNAGTAKFCPKCGSPLNPQPVQETPVQETPVQETQETPVQPVQETPVQPVQETPVQPQFGATQPQFGAAQPQFGATQPQFGATQPQFGAAQPQFGAAQPQFGAVPPYNGDIPRYQPASQMPPQPKKKKKWPIVVAVIAALAAIIAVLGVIFLPKLKESLSPDKHAKAAIKNLGSNFEQTVNNSIDNMSAVSISDKNEISGSIKIDTATFENQKYSDYVKADTLSYNIQADASTQKAAGDVKLQSGSSVLLTVSFYSDGTNVYFKVPELFSESFTVSLAQLTDGSDIGMDSFSDLSMYMSMFDSSSIDLYKEPIKAASQCIAKGINIFAEECEYNKIGELTYQTDNGDIKVTEYGVTVTKTALTNAVNTVIDELYADKSMSSYMSLLTMAGVSQTSLKTEFATLVQDMKPVKFNMYVDKNEEIVRVSVNAKDFDASEEGMIAVSFIGKESKLNHVVFEAEADNTKMKFDVKSENNKCVVAFEMSQDKEYIKAGLDCTNLGSNSVKIDNLYVNCDIEDAKFDVKLSVDSTQKEFSSFKYSSSNFANPINVYKITDAQSYTLQMELVQNINVLSKILSDKVYNQLINGASIN